MSFDFTHVNPLETSLDDALLNVFTGCDFSKTFKSTKLDTTRNARADH